MQMVGTVLPSGPVPLLGAAQECQPDAEKPPVAPDTARVDTLAAYLSGFTDRPRSGRWRWHTGLFAIRVAEGTATGLVSLHPEGSRSGFKLCLAILVASLRADRFNRRFSR
jgi:hypothetical protein